MAKRRTLVLFNPANPGDPAAGMKPLAGLREFEALLARFNTAADGGPLKRVGTQVYYGPGMVIEIASGQREVLQALVACEEDDMAWPVLRAICRASGWKMQDVSSGQVFG